MLKARQARSQLVNLSFPVNLSVKSFVNIPNSDVGRLRHLIEKNTSYGDIASITHDKFRSEISSGTSLANLGVVFIDPAQRLIKAYRSAKLSPTCSYKSFRCFYSEPNRINFYSRLFKEVDVSEFGYIGLQEQFYKSTLLSADWLQTRLFRLPYHFVSSRAKNIDISAEDYEEIRRLYASDFALFEKVTAEFNRRWEQYQQSYRLNVSEDKQVYIHLGPPKTGTSAIQAWLSSHRDVLTSQGIYYPEHTADENGVSSGNFEQLVSLDEQTQRAYFDDVKANALIDKFNQLDCNALLLSSEHFYYYLIWLFSRFPDIDYVFYIRHPLAITESGFHQEVKRHQRTQPFFIPQSIGFNSLEFVKSVSEEFGCRVSYRYYDDCLFEGGGLVADFVSTIGVTESIKVTKKRLNTQYSPGSIALMIKCNHFASEALRRQLDFVLQRYSEDIPSFSFVTNEDFQLLQDKVRQQAKQLADTSSAIDETKLLFLANNYDKPPTVTSEQVNLDLSHLIKHIRRDSPSLFMALHDELMSKSHIPELEDIAVLFNVKWHLKVWCKIRCLLKRIAG